MNYYPFHVGDYAAHTAHLDLLEDLAYRRMLDLYYLRECALPHDPAEVARLIRMRGNVAEVTAVLREFFTEVEGGLVNGRCDEEILRMQDKQMKAKASAEASVAARRAKAEGHRSASAERTLNERSTDAELPTPTPTPTPTPKNKEEAQAPLPDWIPAEAWDGYAEMRKKIRKPMTARAQALVLKTLAGIRDRGFDVEAALDNSTRNGWIDVYEPKASAATAAGVKRGSEEYAALHRNASWWRDAGFESVWDAINAKCWHDNADKYRDGKRVEVAA